MSTEVYVEFSAPIDDYCLATSPLLSMSHSAVGGLTRAQPYDFSFKKQRDSLSPGIFQGVCSGTMFSRVTIEYYQDDADHPFYVYELTDVGIAAMTTKGNEESISLSCRAATARTD